MLCDGYGIRGRWHPGALFQDPALVLHSTNLQLPALMPTALRTRSLPSAQGTKVRRL